MAGKKQIDKVNPGVATFVKSILRLVFMRLFNVKLDLPKEIYDLKPPYVVLPNHQGFWDPFIAASYLKHSVYYITSDAVFRYPLFGFLLKFLGAIPKTKSQSDIDALKHIFAMRDKGRNIGIFPEGQRNWNGTTLPLIKSTSKLVRMLKLPVVTVVFKGGFFSHPRWGTSTRKGELLVEYRLLFRGDEVGSMKVSDIHSKLTEALDFDEIEYQKQKQIEWNGNSRAENIEQLFFVCPSCGSFAGFRSEKNQFSCRDCGKLWEIDKYQVISSSESSRFDNIRDWDAWQLEQMHKLIDEKFGTDQILYQADNVVFHTGFKSDQPKFLSKGSLKLTSEAVVILNSAGEELEWMPIDKVSGITIQNREVFDIYYNNALYITRDPGKHFNAYRFWRAIDYLQREKIGMNLPD
ncbi:MAG TPA: hypothetical protein DCO79_03245 [Spirochaeta sp.]|nr:hypothetical protein [Spirochaeta sp.]